MKKKDNRPAADNNQPEKKPKARKKRKLSPLARVLIIIVLICIIAGSIVAAVLTVYILKYIGSDDTLDLTDVKLSYSTILYAMDESTGEYYEFHRLHDVENRIWVDYDDIPQDLVNGFIALRTRGSPTTTAWTGSAPSGRLSTCLSPFMKANPAVLPSLSS